MKLKIISFNIRCCDDPNGNSIAERAPRLSKITEKYDADIIGLQEFTAKWEEYAEKYYLDKYEMFNKYRSVNEIESCPILWKKDKYDLVDKGYFWLSDTPEVESRGWDELYNCWRIVLYVTLRDKETGKTFTYINTHYGFGDNGQIKSSNLIYEYSQKISSNPIIITGDFNMGPDSLGYATMCQHFTDINTVLNNDMRTTYHGYGKVDDAHIDYCFINEKVKPLYQKMMDETIDGMFPTDHYGLYQELEI